MLDIPSVGTKEFDITALIEKVLGEKICLIFEVVDFNSLFVRILIYIRKKLWVR